MADTTEFESEQETWEAIATERIRLADDLEALTDQQWAAQSQCEAWTVRDVAAHLVTPFETPTMKFVFALIRNRTNLDRTMIDLTARTSARYGASELVARLRENAEHRWTPPGKGPEIPLSEIVVHGQDIRQALGVVNPIPGEVIELALDGVEDDETRNDYARRIGLAVGSA